MSKLWRMFYEKHSRAGCWLYKRGVRVAWLVWHGNTDIMNEEHQAELLRILDSHGPLLEALEATRSRLISMFDFNESSDTIRGIDAGIAAAEGGSDGD